MQDDDRAFQGPRASCPNTTSGSGELITLRAVGRCWISPGSRSGMVDIMGRIHARLRDWTRKPSSELTLVIIGDPVNSPLTYFSFISTSLSILQDSRLNLGQSTETKNLAWLFKLDRHNSLSEMRDISGSRKMRWCSVVPRCSAADAVSCSVNANACKPRKPH